MTHYASENFRTKTDFLAALKRGEKIRVVKMTPWGPEPVETGSCAVSGPHYPEPHKWYASVTVTNGYVTKVS